MTWIWTLIQALVAARATPVPEALVVLEAPEAWAALEVPGVRVVPAVALAAVVLVARAAWAAPVA